MFLAVDIGNTHIVLGLYSDDGFEESWRIASNRKSTEDEIFVILTNLLGSVGYGINEIKHVAIASVVPPICEVWQILARKYFRTEAFLVDALTDTGMPILLDSPAELGSDRIVNGVYGFYKYDGPLIVVDLGTATTFDCISENCEYMGGVIAPGIGICIEALFNSTAKLPRVDFVAPPTAIAKNTVNALQSGVFYGFAGQIDGIVNSLQKEIGSKAKVVATGGLAAMIGKYCTSIEEVDKLLTLDGLFYLWSLKYGF
ncbi:MAG: type III pantothenate kinase [Clostridia bacterium]|nr:type III pantothenate kinase [Clostridia bacterium]